MIRPTRNTVPTSRRPTRARKTLYLDAVLFLDTEYQETGFERLALQISVFSTIAALARHAAGKWHLPLESLTCVLFSAGRWAQLPGDDTCGNQFRSGDVVSLVPKKKIQEFLDTPPPVIEADWGAPPPVRWGFGAKPSAAVDASAEAESVQDETSDHGRQPAAAAAAAERAEAEPVPGTRPKAMPVRKPRCESLGGDLGSAIEDIINLDNDTVMAPSSEIGDSPIIAEGPAVGELGPRQCEQRDSVIDTDWAPSTAP